MKSYIENVQKLEPHLCAYDPELWVYESYLSAKNLVYDNYNPFQPDYYFEYEKYRLVIKRIGLAGCRLAYQLNEIMKT